MQELSLNILDIAQNSIKAEASLIEITIKITSSEKIMSVTVSDNGKGMTEEQVSKVTNPFFTTRTTRKVGLGVPFFKMSAEMTGGSFDIKSAVGKGTVVTAVYHTDHIDMMPLGDIAQTLTALISVNTAIDFVYTYAVDDREFVLDTREIKQILEDQPINAPEVLMFLQQMIEENQSDVDNFK